MTSPGCGAVMSPGGEAPGGRETPRRAILPTPVENPEPFKGQGAYSGLMSLPLSALLLVIDLCPEGVADGFRRPLYEGLSEERRTLQAPMDPGLLATAFRDGRNA